MERYNIRISFKGEDSLKFVLGVVGEIIIYAGRDIYVKGVSANLIENLRSLKQLGLEIVIGGKADGCYKTYDMTKYVPRTLRPEVPVQDKVSTADVKDIISQTSAEISEDIDDEEDEESLNESEDEVESLEDYVITTEGSSAEGKSLKELTERSLKGLLRYLNDEDKEKVEQYLSKE